MLSVMKLPNKKKINLYKNATMKKILLLLLPSATEFSQTLDPI
jgi:hypothetical protein